MLSEEEIEELERLKNDPDVKRFEKSQRDKQRLYALRWKKKQGQKLKLKEERR